MAYDPTGLSALAYANGFTLWHYRTSDAANEIAEEHYFAEAARMLREGDFILLNANVGADPQNALCVIVANEGNSISISDVNAFTAVA